MGVVGQAVGRHTWGGLPTEADKHGSVGVGRDAVPGGDSQVVADKYSGAEDLAGRGELADEALRWVAHCFEVLGRFQVRVAERAAPALALVITTPASASMAGHPPGPRTACNHQAGLKTQRPFGGLGLSLVVRPLSSVTYS
ncbi:MAG: hypothetical protein JWM17_1395 [Actinobacteria bacterium]|nr:hypothetical protein [Actinomycetota bacterium]